MCKINCSGGCIDCAPDEYIDRAPKDRNFLCLTEVAHYDFYLGDWKITGMKWVEAWWDPGDGVWKPEYRIWTGSRQTRTTEPLRPVRWAELPFTILLDNPA